MKQFNRFLFTILFSFLLYTIGYSQNVVFSDNFDSYNAGEQLACQNSIDWTTWSNAPCDPTEDAYVSDAYANSGSNSFVVVQNNDQVHVIPNYTSGKYAVVCYTYIPSGATGYYNTLALFDGGNSEWGFEIYFNDGAIGEFNAGGQNVQFLYYHDTWVLNKLIVDLDNDVAEFWYNGNMAFSWQWSLGADGNGISLQLGGSDFYGNAATDQMYVDDYQVIDLLHFPNAVFSDEFDSYNAGEQLACQNDVDWTTWSNAPCDPTEDAYVSDAYAHSGSNSFVVVQNNDQVHVIPNYTSGKYEVYCYTYIPSGATGYYRTLALFDGGASEVGFEIQFGPNQNAIIHTGGNVSSFGYPYDTWVLNQVVVDLDNDIAEFYYNGYLYETWQWSLGAYGSGISLQLGGSNFYGNAETDQMYVDDYRILDLLYVPVELTSFTANTNSLGQVVLNWQTATETNNKMFEVERKEASGTFATIDFVNGAGTTINPQSYSFVDKNVTNGTYTYRLKQIDFNGKFEYSNEVEVSVTGPKTFDLAQNYPNPFNPTTSITYSVPQAGKVKLAVYNLIGQEVAVLVNGVVSEGAHEVEFNAKSLPSGAYFYKLQSGNSLSVKKMLLLK